MVLVLSSCVLASWFSLVWFATAVMFGLVIVVCGSVWWFDCVSGACCTWFCLVASGLVCAL